MRRTGSKLGWLIVASSVLLVVAMIIVTVIVLRQNSQNTAQENANNIEMVSESTETEAQEDTIRIENLNVYFSSAAWYESAFKECLTNFVRLKGFDATTGSVFYASVPEEEPDSTQYYVQLNDPMQTIVILTWHENEQTVTSSKCSFTREDVINECWNNIQPAERDITPEEEAAFLNQGADILPQEEEGVIP